MSDDELRQTIKIQISRKVGTDSRGRTVWTKPVEPVELELISTGMMQRILASGDEEEKRRIRAAAESKEGVLARDTSSDEFEILDDEELQAALDAAGDDYVFERPADVVLEPLNQSAENEELSLVTTQALRKILGKDEKEDAEVTEVRKDDQVGIDPYNSG